MLVILLYCLTMIGACKKEKVVAGDFPATVNHERDYNRLKYTNRTGNAQAGKLVVPGGDWSGIDVNEENTTADLIEEANNIGGSGDLKVTLLWDFPGDIDLHVEQPNGKEIFFMNTYDRQTGGSLDVDNRIGGVGSAENIFWENPAAGKYTVWIHYYQPSQANGVTGTGDCNIVVMRKGQTPITYTARMSRVGDKALITEFTLQ